MKMEISRIFIWLINHVVSLAIANWFMKSSDIHSHDNPSRADQINKLIYWLQLQSLAWIAISIIAIVAYFCALNFRGMIASLGTITELVLFHMYFHGKFDGISSSLFNL